MNCIDCSRPMRPHTRTFIDEPGTVVHHGRGLCSTCMKRRLTAGTPLPDKLRKQAKDKSAGTEHRTGVVECEGEDCGRMLRPHGAVAEDYPGTYARKAHYRCSTCYENMLTTEGAITPERVATTARTLNAYLQWRKPFREKAGSLL